ncbi:hypothetical protein AB205_0209080, partial [Aquarana catesbeiana]
YPFPLSLGSEVIRAEVLPSPQSSGTPHRFKRPAGPSTMDGIHKPSGYPAVKAHAVTTRCPQLRCRHRGGKTKARDGSVHDLLYWRDVKKSGMVFGAIMVLLLSLAAFSIISVVSYLVLSLLTVTISFRIYKSVMQAVQKSDEGHPFKALLDQDITLSSDSFQKKVSSSLVHINSALKYIVRLFLVEDLIDSLKLALFMWLMTYVGAVFNGITLLILGVLVAFIAPVVYEKYKDSSQAPRSIKEEN